MINYVLAAGIGLVSGVASGLFGVGGGIIMVPAMILLMKLDPKIAIGTSLLVIIPTALMGSFKHYTLGNIHWQTAVALAPLAIVGGYLGAWLTDPIHADNLKRGFGALLVLGGFRMLLFK
jgi:uncharacterized protein